MFQGFLTVIVISYWSFNIIVQVRQVFLEDRNTLFVMALQNIVKSFLVLFCHLMEFIHDNFLFGRRGRQRHDGGWKARIQRPVFGTSITITFEKVLIISARKKKTRVISRKKLEHMKNMMKNLQFSLPFLSRHDSIVISVIVKNLFAFLNCTNSSHSSICPVKKH